MGVPSGDPPLPEVRPAPTRAARLWRAVPLILLILGLVLFFASGFEHYFTLAALRENREGLMRWAARHSVAAPLAYLVLYLVVTAFSIPVATLLSLVGGFLFGPVAGTLWTVLGATGGATLLFLAARSAFADFLRARAGQRWRKLERGFADNALSYMLFLRLVPLFPFWLVNLAPALIGVRLRIFVLGTLIGIVPGTFVFVFLGSSLGGMLDRPGGGIGGMMTPEVVAALVLLGLLALLPVGVRLWRRRGGHG